MTKAEALKLLDDNHCRSNNCNHPVWKTVFDFYKKETGDRSANQCCGSCHTKILKWLQN